MADVLVKPAFQSLATDSGDATKLGPTAWNAARLFSGGADGELLVRRPSPASATGAAWEAAAVLGLVLTGDARLPPVGVAAGSVLASDGVAAAPVWSAAPSVASVGGTNAARIYFGADSAGRPRVRVLDNALAGQTGSVVHITTPVDYAPAENTYGLRVHHAPREPGHSVWANGGILGSVWLEPTNANNYTSRQHGLYGYLHHEGAGLLTRGMGSYNIAGLYGTGAATQLFGCMATALTVAGGTGAVTSLAAAFFAERLLANGGTIATACGLYVEPITAGAINWAVYTEGSTPSFLGGLLTTGNNMVVGSGQATPRIQFGGTTSAFPMLKRASANLQVKLADDSNYTALVANALYTLSGIVYLSGSGALRLFTGTGSPEGAQAAEMGSLYLNISGGAGTTLYVKQTGTGTSGWVGK